MGSIVFSSEEDVPLSSCQEDRRKVRKRDPRPVSQPEPTDGPASEPKPEPTPRERPVEIKTDSLIDIPPAAELPEWSDTEVMPLIIIKKQFGCEDFR